MGMTMIERILARKAGVESVAVGDTVTVDVDMTVLIDLQFATMWLEPLKIADPDKVAIVMDHAVPAPTVKDAAGGPHARRSSDAMVALGVASAIPTILTGAADLTERSPRARRVGVVHLTANVIATALYAASSRARRRDRRAWGIGLALAGATAATVGGMLGGHLAFGHESDAPDDDEDRTP